MPPCCCLRCSSLSLSSFSWLLLARMWLELKERGWNSLWCGNNSQRQCPQYLSNPCHGYRFLGGWELSTSTCTRDYLSHQPVTFPIHPHWHQSPLALYHSLDSPFWNVLNLSQSPVLWILLHNSTLGHLPSIFFPVSTATCVTSTMTESSLVAAPQSYIWFRAWWVPCCSSCLSLTGTRPWFPAPRLLRYHWMDPVLATGLQLHRERSFGLCNSHWFMLIDTLTDHTPWIWATGMATSRRVK